eukprot:comp23632_c1_seq1/m.40282 comp23632_c1_seq1/g.40282  ORF comp23632_c1_seq1/g.40282 comp23632_c1_seq1/m.40282 type:complete len:505 (-) comp23632_c1_seq1:315-1829(-)
MSDDDILSAEDYSDLEESDHGEDDGLYDVDMADEEEKRGHGDEFEFTILKPVDLIESQLKAIGDINQVLMIPNSTARQLLHFLGWDKERCLERYYDDPEKLFKEANVANPNKTKKMKTNGQTKYHCEICYDDVPQSEVYGMGCDHVFCKACWNEYLTTKIMDEGMSQQIACPATDCSILVDELTVSDLLKDPAVLKKYQYLIAKAFVGVNKHVKWCPAPGCDNAAKVVISAPKPITCLCGNMFCFGCLQQPHDPVKCGMLKKWLKKCADDSETANWISANTKECPKCQTTIEKNGGCNHMTCRSQTCKYEFCWVCMGPWEPHGSSWYNCNRFDEKKDGANQAKESSHARVSLERYLHYYNRYANHDASGRMEKALYEKVEKTMHEMQVKHGMSWIEVQFLRKAVDTLSQCRNTLKYTYVFAFYLNKNNQSAIFEDNQRDLEMATETLSGYLEQELSDDEIASIKQKVLDKGQYCETRRKVLLEHVNKGYEDGYWDFSLPREDWQ